MAGVFMSFFFFEFLFQFKFLFESRFSSMMINASHSGSHGSMAVVQPAMADLGPEMQPYCPGCNDGMNIIALSGLRPRGSTDD